MPHVGPQWGLVLSLEFPSLGLEASAGADDLELSWRHSRPGSAAPTVTQLRVSVPGYDSPGRGQARGQTARSWAQQEDPPGISPVF